jgi:DNA-binding response OmpR family regulator
MAKILIIEDEKDIALMLARRLASNGHQTLMGLDAYQGLSLACREKPDVILLDLMLPAGGGFKVLENVRASTHIMHTPIIVITAVCDEETRKRALEAGADEYMTKPCDMEKLKELIQNLLKKK